MRVTFTRGASLNLDEIAAWIGQDNPKVAGREVARLIDACEALSQHPLRFPLIGRGGIRKRPCGSHLIFYRVTDRVEILRVLHAARHWADLLDDLN